MGATYAAKWRGTRVAVKVTTFKPDASGGDDPRTEGEMLEHFRTELGVVSKLRHPNVCLFLGVAVAPPTYCLVLEAGRDFI